MSVKILEISFIDSSNPDTKKSISFLVIDNGGHIEIISPALKLTILFLYINFGRILFKSKFDGKDFLSF